MIVAEQKPLDEIKTLLGDAERVLVVGCGTCVTVCFAGGEKEAGILGSLLRMSSKLNGPCGGSSKGKCEVNPDIECAWQLIYDKLKAQGRLHLLMEITPPKDWRTSRDGGPRKIVREDLRLPTAEKG